MRVERLINYRPALLLAAGALCGVFISSLFSVRWVIYTVAALIFIAAIIAVIRKKKTALFLIAFLICFLSFRLISVINSSEKVYLNAEITARVSEAGKGYAVLENIEAEGASLKGRAYIETGKDLIPGEIIVARGELTENKLEVTNSYSVWLYKNNYKFTGKIHAVNSVEKSYLMPDEWVRSRFKSAMAEAVGEETSGIAAALLFGDKGGLKQDTYNAVKASGLAHIFAVSGLHIGFLISVLSFFLRKVRKSVSLPVTVAALLFYTYLSGFSPSVIRAVLMAFFMLLAGRIGAPKDILSALSLTVFLVLVFKPVFLFEVGFLMSVTSVLGIILLYPLTYKFFGSFLKGKFLSGVAKTFAVSFSANIALLPVLANSFGAVSLYFPFSNLLALPVATAAFIYLIAVMPAITVFPSLSPLSLPGGAMLIAVREIAVFVAGLPFAVLPFFMSVGIGSVWSFGYIVWADYINLTKKLRLIAFSAVWACAGIVALVLIV